MTVYFNKKDFGELEFDQVTREYLENVKNL